MTPEGKIKQKIKKLLDMYGEQIYIFMPVQSGYGAVTVDFLCCINGRFVAIEAKAPGKKPTPRQDEVLRRVEAARGIWFVIDDEDSLIVFKAWLEAVMR